MGFSATRAFVKSEAQHTPGGSTRSDAEARALAEAREREAALALDTDKPYRAFREAASRIRGELPRLLERLKRDGKKVYVYGASTKGNTLLQYCGVDHRLVAKAADRNPEKWGRHTLGTDIPIVSEDEARGDRPDYFLVLPWHFLPGFIEREAEFLSHGGRFIVPLPRLRLVGAGGRELEPS